MSIGRFLIYCGLLVLACGGVVSGQDAAALSPPDQPTIISHDLVVELTPDSHQLVARDQVDLELPLQAVSGTFTLAPTLEVESILWRAPPVPGQETKPDQALSFTQERLVQPFTQRIVVTLPAGHAKVMSLIWHYRGVINDPPREPRRLRFVTPSETAGHIGSEGVYLSSESQWYPDVAGSLSTYRVAVQVPQGWTVITQGKKTDETANDRGTSSTWIIREQSEALTLVANKFVTKSREWKGSNGQRIELATYFFPDNAELAEEYLDATSKYLDAYIALLGDYPFEKFAVVENFFASGLGMPSFTLLGSGSIKRHYVQAYALGHEIVHSWIGNSLFNRTGQSNWVEGLTTYLANYYWHELTQDAPQAVEQRRMMIQGYSQYVAPEQDYPVAQFLGKVDERDNAIGYQKSAFLFHLLRREIGDESFWRGLKVFVSRYRNRYADWSSIEGVFSEESHRDLRWFFEQWIEQPGAPIVSLGEVTARRTAGEDGQESWQLTVHMRQAGKPFRMTIPIRIVMKGAAETRWVMMSQTEERVEFLLPHQPLSVVLDPDLMVFRRLARTHMPPMLNSYVTDQQRTLVQAFSGPASPLQQVVARIADQESQLPASRKTNLLSIEKGLPSSGSLLILAGADQQQAVQSVVRESCGDLAYLRDEGFQIDGQEYEGPTMAALFSCHRASVPGSVVTVFYGVTPQAVAKVSRLLFYYGWQSYVLFRDGVAVKRDLWQTVQDMKEVMVDGER